LYVLPVARLRRGDGGGAGAQYLRLPSEVRQPEVLSREHIINQCGGALSLLLLLLLSRTYFDKL
jgi:hypothetical protein